MPTLVDSDRACQHLGVWPKVDGTDYACRKCYDDLSAKWEACACDEPGLIGDIADAVMRTAFRDHGRIVGFERGRVLDAVRSRLARK